MNWFGRALRTTVTAASVVLILGACSGEASTSEATPASTGGEPTTTAAPKTTMTTTVAASTSTTTLTSSTTPRSTSTTTTEPPRLGSPRPAWLGTVELPLRPGEDNGIAQPTPPELVDRQLWTEDVLPPPVDDVFVSALTTPPPPDVVTRSTWREGCPVGLDELSYAQVSFVGFDGLFHTGELIVHRDIAPAVVEIFRRLHAARFPIEEMQVTTQGAVDAHPTGDSNNTSSFVCRQAVNSGTWSRHAYGGAIDINPFHNPYLKGDLVLPELASAYLDRDRDVPGMITPEVEALFAEIGWGWGGNWSSASDWMHFSDTGG